MNKNNTDEIIFSKKRRGILKMGLLGGISLLAQPIQSFAEQFITLDERKKEIIEDIDNYINVFSSAIEESITMQSNFEMKITLSFESLTSEEKKEKLNKYNKIYQHYTQKLKYIYENLELNKSKIIQSNSIKQIEHCYQIVQNYIVSENAIKELSNVKTQLLNLENEVNNSFNQKYFDNNFSEEDPFRIE